MTPARTPAARAISHNGALSLRGGTTYPFIAISRRRAGDLEASERPSPLKGALAKRRLDLGETRLHG